MIVTVKTEHFRSAIGFVSNTQCPLALAIRDVLPNSRIVVGVQEVDIDDKKNLPLKGWTEGAIAITDVYAKIKLAKEGNEVEPINVEIIGI